MPLKYIFQQKLGKTIQMGAAMLGKINIFTRGDIVRWVVTLMVIAIDAAWLALTERSIVNAWSWVILLAFMIMFLFFIFALGMALLMSVNKFQAYRETATRVISRRVGITVNYLLLMFVFIQSLVILNYLAITLDAPVIENQLDAIDKLLGFDWLLIFSWVQRNDFIKSILSGVYATLGLQALIIPVFLGIMGRDRLLGELSSNMMVSFLLMIVISTPFPAHSAFIYYGAGGTAEISMLSHFDVLRDGTMKIFDIGDLQGLVSIPSMHTAAALLLAYSLRSFIGIFPLISLLNVIMIISTPTEGGHYLVDTLAGMMLGGVTIMLTHAMASKEVVTRQP